MSNTVWDYPYEASTPRHDAVDGKVVEAQHPLFSLMAEIGVQIGNLGDQVKKQTHRWEQAYGNAPIIDKSANTAITDVDGNLSATLLYRCEPGYECYLHRLIITAEGIDATSPITQGSLTFYRNANTVTNLIYFLPIQGTSGVVAPAVFESGSNSSAQFTERETLQVIGTGLPDGQLFGFSVQFQIRKLGYREGTIA